MRIVVAEYQSVVVIAFDEKLPMLKQKGFWQCVVGDL